MPGMHRFQSAVRQWSWLAVAIAAALVLGWGTYQIGHLRAQAEALSTALELQRGQAEASGQQPVAPAAREIWQNPEIVAEPMPPSDEQVQTAVNAWFDANGVDIPPSLIAAELAAYFERNPPPAGKPGEPGEDASPVTAAQIADAADTWLEANIERLRGEDGEPGEPGQDGADGQDGQDGKDGQDGQDGRTPTADELAALIRAELAKLQLPLCPDGWKPRTVEAVTVDRLVQTILVCVPA